MTDLEDLIRELACAVRKQDFERADEALSVISVRSSFGRAIAKGRRDASPHEPTLLDTPNVVTIHDLPSRDGIEIVRDRNWLPVWRKVGAA